MPTLPILFFDFDETVVSNNYTYQQWMEELAGEGEESPTPKGLKDTTAWQKIVFGYLFDKGVKADGVLKRAEDDRELTPGMGKLLADAKSELGTHIVVISDNCSSVVEHTIQAMGRFHIYDFRVDTTE